MTLPIPVVMDDDSLPNSRHPEGFVAVLRGDIVNVLVPSTKKSSERVQPLQRRCRDQPSHECELVNDDPMWVAASPDCSVG